MKHRRLFVALTFASSLLAATANAGHLTRDNGAQVGDNQNSQTAGADGPVLLQDVHLIQKLQRFEDRRGNAAVLGAIFKGEVGIARQLMAAACTTHQRNHAGQTPAMFAALFQRTGILQALKSLGADMQAREAAGKPVQALGRGEFSAR